MSTRRAERDKPILSGLALHALVETFFRVASSGSRLLFPVERSNRIDARAEETMSSCGWFPMRPDEIRAWVEQHPDALPRTVSDLGRFPMAFRRVMLTMVSPEVRLQLWREHLETFLGPDSTLTPDQRGLVAATIPELPRLFAAAPAPNPVMSEWERGIAATFSRQDAGRVFMLIGPPEPPEGIPLPDDVQRAPAV